MILNDAGEMMVRWWLELPNKFPNVNVDIFVVMPNHVHGIILIMDSVGDNLVGDDLRVAPDLCDDNMGEHAASSRQTNSPRQDQPRPNAPLSQMIQWFKTMTTNEYIRGVKQLGWKPFKGKVWQGDNYEHIIRNEAEADRIARYIEFNPARWNDDKENPSRK